MVNKKITSFITEPSVLAAQSLIVGDPGTYTDYRDYILSLVSNPALLNCPIRINIENKNDVLTEFSAALKKNGFTNFLITGTKPSSWSKWMTEQLEATNTNWVMPFPGDHIYLHPDSDSFVSAVLMAEKLSADAIAYGHVDDFEKFLDWRKLKILYADDQYVLFDWGEEWERYHNRLLQVRAQHTISKFLSMPAILGYCIYSKELMLKILEGMPEKNVRWHDMERIHIPETKNYKILIPRKLLYYHVHNYWLGLYYRCKAKGIKVNNIKNINELHSLYIPTEYDWKSTTPKDGVERYSKKVVSAFPEVGRYLLGNTFKSISQSTKRVFWETATASLSIFCAEIVFLIYFFPIRVKGWLRRNFL